MSQLSSLHMGNNKNIHLTHKKVIGQGLIKNNVMKGYNTVKNTVHGMGLISDAKNGFNAGIKKIKGLGINPVVGDFAIPGVKLQDNKVVIGKGLENIGDINFNKSKQSLRDLKNNAIQFII